jgi:glyoxylase-like metal-dependent hydrolase (beta-lactamase superfamily II)
MQLGNWQIDILNGGRFRIDGGGLFGVVPKSLWEPLAAPDAQNRVLCANYCLLARDGRHTVLVDTGCGTKFGLLDRKHYDLEPGDPLLESLAALGVAPDQIDTVVLGHLHFDHAGGITRYDSQRRLTLTFPRARHVLGRIEWYDATSGSADLHSAYSADNLLPLEQSGQLVLVGDGEEVLPGLTVRLTGGHTRGHMAVLFQSNGQGVLHPGDLFPTAEHIRRLWCTAYDVNLADTRHCKPMLLAEAAEKNWVVVWTHDPRVAASRVERHPKREFVICDPRSRL